MNRLRSIGLALLCLFLAALPARAEPRVASTPSIAFRLWQALLDVLPTFPTRLSPAPAPELTSDPAGSSGDADRGVDIDPDGLAADGDRGAELDPDG